MSNECLVRMRLTSTKDTHSSHTVEELLTYKHLTSLLLKKLLYFHSTRQPLTALKLLTEVKGHSDWYKGGIRANKG